jgi:hypothetical protein
VTWKTKWADLRLGSEEQNVEAPFAQTTVSSSSAMDPRAPDAAQRGRGGARRSLPASASSLPAQLLAAALRRALIARSAVQGRSLRAGPPLCSARSCHREGSPPPSRLGVTEFVRLDALRTGIADCRVRDGAGEMRRRPWWAVVAWWEWLSGWELVTVFFLLLLQFSVLERRKKKSTAMKFLCANMCWLLIFQRQRTG